jgi:hypothetical protein
MSEIRGENWKEREEQFATITSPFYLSEGAGTQGI